MLVKFQNNSEEFQQKVEVLKNVLGVGAASKVAEYCVDNYHDLDVRFHKSEKKVERLLDIIDGLRDAINDKKDADKKIKKLLGEKL